MKKILCLLLVLLSALLLTGCGGEEAPAAVIPAEEQTPEEQEQLEQSALQHFDLSVTIEDGEDVLTPGQERVMRELLTRWYTFIGTFTEIGFDNLFDPDYVPDNGISEAKQHTVSCRTLVAIRQAALEDLHLDRCNVTLTVSDVTQEGNRLHVEAVENSVMHFADVDVDSELIDLPHVFDLSLVNGDEWLIRHHEADDNPYFSASYTESSDVDKNLPILLRNIERRQLLRSEQSVVELPYDVAYNRGHALVYMLTYAVRRNSEWAAYDDGGGNCMNFASQVLLAGGIPMDTTGGAMWYWYGDGNLDLSFINVEHFLEYARCNEGYGLVADIDAGYYTGEIGDLVIFGINSDRHATVICGLVEDRKGETIDYLLCSNTTNYRYFPAGAYYYTDQRLVKIYGWNEAA